MEYYKKLCGNLCYLSPVSGDEGENWARWFNDLTVSLPLGNEAVHVTSLKKADEIASSMESCHELVFAIVDLRSNEPIGRIHLSNVHSIYGTGDLEMFIGEKKFRNREYGVEALNLALDFAFNFLNLHHVFMEFPEFNKELAYYCQEAGFSEIGRRREAHMVCDRYFDVLFMDKLTSEFTSPFVKKAMEHISN